MSVNPWLLTPAGRAYLVEEYVNKGRSTYDIAEGLDTHANTIRRALKRHLIPLREMSVAQKASLQRGRRQHPTQGRTRTPAEKVNIADGVSKFWQNNEQRKEEYRKIGESLASNANGFEVKNPELNMRNAVAKSLVIHGYYVECPTKIDIFDIDIFLPKQNVVIDFSATEDVRKLDALANMDLNIIRVVCGAMVTPSRVQRVLLAVRQIEIGVIPENGIVELDLNRENKHE